MSSLPTLMVTSVAVVTMKFLFGMCNCMADSDAGKGDYLLMQGILQTCEGTHIQAWTD